MKHSNILWKNVNLNIENDVVLEGVNEDWNPNQYRDFPNYLINLIPKFLVLLQYTWSDIIDLNNTITPKNTSSL